MVEVFIRFLFIVLSEERSRKGATPLLAAIPGFFFGRLVFVFCCFFFEVFVFLCSPPRSHCSITMSGAAAAEYKCVLSARPAPRRSKSRRYRRACRAALTAASDVSQRVKCADAPSAARVRFYMLKRRGCSNRSAFKVRGDIVLRCTVAART